MSLCVDQPVRKRYSSILVHPLISTLCTSLTIRVCNEAFESYCSVNAIRVIRVLGEPWDLLTAHA